MPAPLRWLLFSAPVLACTLTLGVVAAQPDPVAGQRDAQAPPAPDEVAAPRDVFAELDRELVALQSRPGGLTAAEVAARATAESHEVIQYAHQVRAADAEVDAARLRFAPRLTLSASYLRLSPIDPPSLGTVVVAPGAAPRTAVVPGQPLMAVPLGFPSPENQTRLSAQLVVPLTDYFARHPQLLAGSKDKRSSAGHNLSAQRARAAAEGQLAYYAWVRAVFQHVTARQAHARARDHFEDARRLHSAGLATIADVSAVEARVAQAELIETRGESNVTVTAEQLRARLALPPGAPLEIGDRVMEPPPPPAHLTLDAAWREAQRSRPELVALEERERQLGREAAALRAAELPRVDAIGEVLSANPNPRYVPPQEEFNTTWAVGVQASWTINDLPGQAAARRSVKASASAVAAQRAALKESLRAELAGSLRGVDQAQRTIDAALRGVRAAEVTYRVRRQQYLSGQARSVELTDAETELTRARVEYIDALIDARVAALRLAYTLGRPLPTR